jgi:signal transduction histidine kinase
VYAAVPDDDEQEAVRRLIGAVAVGLPVIVGVLTLITWLLVGRALRPVDAANRRQREFVTDAAHELRSPLAAMRTQLEVASAHPNDVSWQRLVGNLVDNAVRHAQTQVTVTLTADENTAVLTVSNDGPGVPVGDRERIFERFTRLDDARSRVSGGAGLGLAIVREVAQAHGGSASVAEAGPGATFVVRLPIMRSTGEVSDDRPQRPAAQPDVRPTR